MRGLDKNLLRFDYNVTLQRVEKKSGRILDVETIHNTIVNTGLNLVRDFLGDVAVDAPKYIAIGTGDTAVQNTDVALETENTRAEATIDNETNYQVEFSKTFEFAGDYAITEAGLFDRSVASGSTMFNRTVFAAKNVTTEIDLIVTVTLTVGRAA
jgi:hypothetical protein